MQRLDEEEEKMKSCKSEDSKKPKSGDKKKLYKDLFGEEASGSSNTSKSKTTQSQAANARLLNKRCSRKASLNKEAPPSIGFAIRTPVRKR